jgi:hypothetical protein
MFTAQVAYATSGYITGRVRFYNANGQFCPAGRAPCNGAFYTYNDLGYTGVPEITLTLHDENHNDIGTTTTDTDGFFFIHWISSSGATNGHFVWYAAHAGQRFHLDDASGNPLQFQSNPNSLVDGTTIASPQQWGNINYGTSASPRPNLNVYWSAWMMWSSLYYSGYMRSRFSDVEIRFNSSQCATSCAEGWNNRIYLDTNANTPYSPIARVMHEMGHIASYVGSENQEFDFTASYEYGGNDGWNYTTPEYGSVQFEEAYATFLAATAFYWDISPDPHVCGLVAQSTACNTNYHNLESSSYPNCNVDAEENRWPLTAMRYLWDIYDNASADGMNVAWWKMVENITFYGGGTNNHEKNEPWDEVWHWLPPGYQWEITDEDGRSVTDYKYHLLNSAYAIDSTAVYQANCSPPGD